MRIRKNLLVTIFLTFALIVSSVSIQGCATLKARHAVPTDQIYNARIPGMPNVRVVIDYTDMQASIIKLEQAGAVEMPVAVPEPAEIVMLAISGGGAGGAFGAGLLCGWTESGNRPEFNIVTGISTGALSSPAAFLGPKHDSSLRELYTATSDKDILRKRRVLSILMGSADSLMDTKPLARILECYVTMDVMKEIAEEHKKGRRLYVGTSQLDAQRMVIWDMGAVASIGTPRALELFHKILLASAAIPVAFPPVLFEVEADGKKYDEMHVDGGISTQTFGNALLVEKLKEHPSSKGKVYILYNEKMISNPATVKQGITAIAASSISMMIASQGVGDLFRMYETAGKNGVGFNLAYIPTDFDVQQKSSFDPAYMSALFDLAYSRAKSGYPWDKDPSLFNFKKGKI